MAAAIIGCILIGTVVVVLVVPPVKQESNFTQIGFSEVQVLGSTTEQFIELHTSDDIETTLEGWTIKHGSKTLTLPAIAGLGSNCYILITFQAGYDDVNAADKNATVHLPQATPFLQFTGSLVLQDGGGLVVDYICWGGVMPGDSPSSNSWLPSDWGIWPGETTGTSMQRWGEDFNNSTNWYVNGSTPGEANAMEFLAANGTVPVIIHNGITEELPLVAGDDFEFAGGPVVSGTPANWTTKADIEEMAKFTLDFYKSMGFPAPYLGSDGKLDIHISKGNKSESTGACSREGSVYVNVGKKGGLEGKVSLKNCVEHEIMHACQAQLGADGKHDHWANDANRPFTEGLAVWGGIASAMKNYKLTWNQVMSRFWDVDDHNWFEHFRDLNNTFIPFGHSYSDYMGAGLFFKFLNETWGVAKLVEITNGIKNYWNKSQGVDVTAQESIANALGISFDEVVRRFHEWLVSGAAKKANGFPPLPPHSTPAAPTNATSPPVKDGPKTVQPYGGDIEFINCAGKTTKFTLNFGDLDGNSKWKITIIYTRPDGTQEIKWFSIYSTVAPVPVDPTQWANITIIKTRIGDTGNGKISMTITPVPPDSYIGDRRENPYHSNCSAGPETTSNVLLRYLPDSFFDIWFEVWIEEFSTVIINATNASGGPMENYLGIDVVSLNESTPVHGLSFSPPELNPKIANYHSEETTFYYIRISWDVVAAAGYIPPPSSEILVDVTLSFS